MTRRAPSDGRPTAAAGAHRGYECALLSADSSFDAAVVMAADAWGPAGLVSDFLNRKALMILCDAGRFVALSSIALAAFVGTPTVAHIAIVSAVEATLGVLFAPAEGVVLRSIVAPGQRRDAVTRNEARSETSGLRPQPSG